MFAKLAPLGFQAGSEFDGARARPRGAIVDIARPDASGPEHPPEAEKQAGMSMLDFYRNRAERVLSARERQDLKKAKSALRAAATEPKR
jgi:uncharacterized protein DUF3175